ncbi:ATP-binding cassette domain-containing protein [Variovorax paradoxus]|jgi:ABC-2 type transport system ATP-binding protein|uniref:ATP-binding cassette domain-containing protein n=1 Tax=Variovorax paradoxus TaxID=34073 RepID=UPI0029C66C77|nr:ATP-binding cassette domain-containing protein [Variovorax paradoxus]WPH22218.1 ATP-binding cassette domain-containing protein [Variovorax paradoxus]
MHDTGPAVAARSLHKRFVAKGSKQVVRALDDVSLEVPTGTLTALVGPDGAGKTTLLRLMAGLMRADEGELRVLGIDVSADPQAVQDRISYMPQRFGLYDDLSVQENLDLYADLHGVSAGQRRERYARLMEMTDLGRFTKRPAGKLSGGMKQKLGLACTLVRSPDLLLLDEPTVGVDPLSRRELWQIVQQLVDEEKLSVIVSTAYLDEAERCSHVFVLQEGRLIAEGTPDEIRDHAEGTCFVAAPPEGEAPRLMQARLLDARQEIVDAVPQGGEVHFIRHRDTDDAALEKLLAGARAEPVPPRLEDGFMTLLRTRQGADTHIARSAASDGLAPAEGEPGEVVIEVKDLVRRFGDFVAVASTSFSVGRGEIFGLLGPNGAGKTTTFRMLCGLLPASGGQLRVAGVDLRHARAQARQRIGYVSQKFALYGNLTVRENLSFFGGAYGLRGQKLQGRMDTVLRQFDLERELDAPSGQLPGGYRQRLAMATGLLHEPEILFLDEPTSGADPLARREFWRRITALAEGGTTVVITTHFMEEAEYCDRIVIQDAGKVLAIGTPREVRAQAQGGANGEQRIDMEQAFIGIVEKARQKERRQQ